MTERISDSRCRWRIAPTARGIEDASLSAKPTVSLDGETPMTSQTACPRGGLHISNRAVPDRFDGGLESLAFLGSQGDVECIHVIFEVLNGTWAYDG